MRSHSRFRRTMTLGALAVTLMMVAVGVGACSGESENANSNDQDATFAKEMIPHHAQAVEMAELAETRASHQRVKELAQQIKGAQQPEIDRMNGWLESWGHEKIDGDMSTHEHMAAGHTMPGMMSAEDMSKLMAAQGVLFDRMFLQMMIDHHKGAIEMANEEAAKGKNPEAKSLAGDIVTAQQAEVVEMEKLLTELK